MTSPTSSRPDSEGWTVGDLSIYGALRNLRTGGVQVCPAFKKLKNGPGCRIWVSRLVDIWICLLLLFGAVLGSFSHFHEILALQVRRVPLTHWGVREDALIPAGGGPSGFPTNSPI